MTIAGQLPMLLTAKMRRKRPSSNISLTGSRDKSRREVRTVVFHSHGSIGLTICTALAKVDPFFPAHRLPVATQIERWPAAGISRVRHWRRDH